MLTDFLTTHRDAIVTRANRRIAPQAALPVSVQGLLHGVPVFLDQLGEALTLAESTSVVDHEQLYTSARQHGGELLRSGLTIGQVVHVYGNVCQAITELAVHMRATIPSEQFQTLNLCLDDAIAGAVSEYSAQRERTIRDQGSESLGILAHELRNVLNTAMLSFDSIKKGRIAAGGSTGLILERSLLSLRDLIDRSLSEVRLDAGIEAFETISVADFIAEVEIGATIQAEAKGLLFAVHSLDPTLMITGDRQILAATLANLLQNAFKFTHKHGRVSLTVRATADRVLFDVEDECGGLPPGSITELFKPFVSAGADRTGVGLGLSICVKAAKAHGGEIRAVDLPGKGCLFTLDLPRQPNALG